jgi:nucleoside-diphosphate-sugar epimerase
MDLLKITPKTHVVITGGAGFIGSHISARLLRAGARVTILTRHIESPRARALTAQGADVVEWDCSSPLSRLQSNRVGSAQMFYHLAADIAVASPALHNTNVAGTRRALDLVEMHQIPYFIYASSIEAQGLSSDSESPLTEGDPCRPVSDYGVSKAEAEELVMRWGGSSTGKALILRIGNIYGPGSAWLLHPCVMALIGLGPLTHAWPKLQHRRFQPLYLNELIDAVLGATSHELTGIYNVTGKDPISIGEYLYTLARLTGLADVLTRNIRSWDKPDASVPSRLAADFQYFLMGQADRCHRLYDNTKIRREIGEYTRWPFARGLAATLSWYYASGLFPATLKSIQGQKGSLCMSH